VENKANGDIEKTLENPGKLKQEVDTMEDYNLNHLELLLNSNACFVSSNIHFMTQ